MAPHSPTRADSRCSHSELHMERESVRWRVNRRIRKIRRAITDSLQRLTMKGPPSSHIATEAHTALRLNGLFRSSTTSVLTSLSRSMNAPHRMHRMTSKKHHSKI